LGAEKDWRESTGGVNGSADLFYKHLMRVPVVGESIPGGTKGEGRVFGLQTQVRYSIRKWSTALAYTLSRSTRWAGGEPEFPYEYDQTHSANWLATFKGEKWTISSRVRYTTGNPRTPSQGSVYDVDTDTYLPMRGGIHSARVDPFFQWDLRFDRRYVYTTWIYSWYLDIQNVTNRKNVERLIDSYDYSRQVALPGLPIFPSFGFKGEF
jgi:hypothetical protein